MIQTDPSVSSLGSEAKILNLVNFRENFARECA